MFLYVRNCNPYRERRASQTEYLKEIFGEIFRKIEFSASIKAELQKKN